MLCAWAVVLALAPGPTDVSDPAAPSALLPAVGGREADRAEERRRERYLRTGLETTAILAVQSIWYWSHPSAQARDWDLKFDWSSWQRKLDLDAVRFDSNRLETNVFLHPLSGTAYYQVARDNGLGMGQSYLSSFMASFFWEYMIEFRELPSLNDIVVTPAAGVAIGEPAHRFSRLLATRRSPVARVLSWALSPISSINDLLLKRDPRDEPGPSWSRLCAEVGAVSTDRGGPERREELSLALGGSLVAHHGYRRWGRGGEAVRPGSWSALSLRGLIDRSDGPSGVDFHAGTLFAGRYQKSYDPGGGTGLMLGLGSSFDFDARTLSVGPGWDRIGSIGLLGPAMEWTLDRSWVGLTFSLTATYSFAMVDSLAYALHGEELAGQVVRSSLRGAGYYYGHGLTSRSRLDLRLLFFELALAGDLGLYRSLQGRDRFQEKLDTDFALDDSRATWSALLSVPVGRTVRLAGRLEQERRRSRFLDQRARAAETRVGLLFAFTL